jgi:hypothetical protein
LRQKLDFLTRTIRIEKDVNVISALKDFIIMLDFTCPDTYRGSWSNVDLEGQCVTILMVNPDVPVRFVPICELPISVHGEGHTSEFSDGRIRT